MAYYIGGGAREEGGHWVVFLFLLVLPGGPSDLGYSWPGFSS